MIHLYIKKHNITGLRYFGRTYQNPFVYKGSGKKWKAHLKAHGNNISTTHVWSYVDINEAIVHALKFSIDNDIVNSNEWANLAIENVVDGNHKGFKLSPESIALRTNTRKINAKPCVLKGRPAHPNTVANLKLVNTGRKLSSDVLAKRLESRRRNGVKSLKGIPRSDEVKLKISTSKLGHTHSNETLEKLKAGQQRRRLRENGNYE